MLDLSVATKRNRMTLLKNLTFLSSANGAPQDETHTRGFFS